MEQNYSFIKPKSINDTYTIKKYISLLKDNNINTGDSINKNNMKIVENYFDYVVDYNEKNIIYNKILTLLGKHIKNNNIFLYTKYFEDFSDFLFCDKTKSIYIGGFKTSNSYDIYLHRWIIYNNIDNTIIDVNNLFDGVFNESYSFERPKSINNIIDTSILVELERKGIYTDAIVKSDIQSDPELKNNFKLGSVFYKDTSNIYEKIINIVEKDKPYIFDNSLYDINTVYFYEIIKNYIYLTTYFKFSDNKFHDYNQYYLIVNLHTNSIIYKDNVNESYSFERPKSINDTYVLQKLENEGIYTDAIVDSNFISKIHDKFKMYNDIDDIDTYNKLVNIIRKNRSDINVNDDIAIYFYEIIKNNIYLITYCTDDNSLNDRYLIININTESIIYKNDINESEYNFERPKSINDTINHLKKLKQFDIYTGKVQNTDDYVNSINKLLNFYPNVIHKYKNADTEYFFNDTLIPILKTYNKFNIKNAGHDVLSTCIKINNDLYVCFLLDYSKKYSNSNRFIWIIVDTYNKKIIYNND